MGPLQRQTHLAGPFHETFAETNENKEPAEEETGCQFHPKASYVCDPTTYSKHPVSVIKQQKTRTHTKQRV